MIETKIKIKLGGFYGIFQKNNSSKTMAIVTPKLPPSIKNP